MVVALCRRSQQKRDNKGDRGLPLRLLFALLFACFLVIQPPPSEALAQEVIEQYMTCSQDSYDRLSKECRLALYRASRSDEVAAIVECYHGNDTQTFPCGYEWISSSLEYSCTSPSGEMTLFKPLDMRSNPQRVCSTLCKGCLGLWKKR
jgi:hypothetical protein